MPCRCATFSAFAHGETAVQESLLVELRDGGLSGYGEGAPLPYYGVTAATIRQALEAARSRIEAETLDDPAALWQRMLPLLSDQRFALAPWTKRPTTCGAKSSASRSTICGAWN